MRNLIASILQLLGAGSLLSSFASWMGLSAYTQILWLFERDNLHVVGDAVVQFERQEWLQTLHPDLISLSHLAIAGLFLGGIVLMAGIFINPRYESQ